MGKTIHQITLVGLGALLAAGPLAAMAQAEPATSPQASPAKEPAQDPAKNPAMNPAKGATKGSPAGQGAPLGEDDAPPRPPVPRGYTPKTERERFLEQRYGDYHVAVVGDEIITRSELLIYLSRNLKDDPTVGVEGLSEMEVLQMRYFAALEELLDAKLKTQGGENLGFDPELIARATDSAFQNQIERWGGAQKATDALREMQFTPAKLKAYYRDRMLGQSWEATMTGEGPGPTGRPIQDAYIRPGELFSRYRELASSRNPEDLEKVGKTFGAVTIQEFLTVVPSPAQVAESERFVLSLRENIEGGVFTFEQAVDQYADPNFQGEASFTRDAPMSPLGKALVRKHPGYEVQVSEFLSDPKAGDLSEVMPIIISGRTEAFALYRIVAATPPTPLTSFTDLQLQLRLEKEITDAQSELRIDRGLADLVRSTYVAPLDLRRELLLRGTRPPKRTSREQSRGAAPAPKGQPR